MFTVNLIPLQVVIPLLLSPLCAAINHARLAWFIAALSTWTSFVIALLIVAEVGIADSSMDANASLSYAMGGWAPPFGIEYRINRFNALLLLLVTGVASLLMPFAYASVKAEIAKAKQALFYTIYLLCFAGLLGICVTNDAFNIYVFLEISSLATYTLVAIGKNRKALTAAFEYLILGSIGATFYLIGIGLLYMATGTLNFTDLSVRITATEYDAPVITGFAFLAVGLLLKVALFPLHSWLCQAYTYAPSFVAAFLSATATKVSLYVLIRILYELFGKDFEFTSVLSLERIVAGSLYPLSLITIIAGSYMAIYMQDIKKSLAYSSVAQIGYIMLGMSMMSEAGLTAAITHIFNHALAKAGLFVLCGAVLLRFHGNTIEHFKGIGKLMPLTMAAGVLCCLSMIGVPLTAGFISKWVLIQAVFEHGKWYAIIVILLGSLMSILYMWRLIEAAYFYDHPNAISATKTEAPLPVLLSLWLFALLIVYFGINTDYSLLIATNVTETLVSGGK